MPKGYVFMAMRLLTTHVFILQSKERETLVLVLQQRVQFNWSPNDIAIFKMKWNLFALQFIWNHNICVK